MFPGICESNFDFKRMIIKFITQRSSLCTHCEIFLKWMPQNLKTWEANIDLGNGFVTSGTKPLLEAILSEIYVSIWRL